MSETCIVCLGDLGESANSLLLPHAEAPNVKNEQAEYNGAVLTFDAGEASVPSNVMQLELIAHLLPCGHNLHDECLKPWVERANSCPICRQNFNQVNLSAVIGGPLISSYAVNDRVQVAEIDPAMIIDDSDDTESLPCPVCGKDDNEDVLLLCDGCEKGYHTYCVDLDSVPVGQWFCEDCTINSVVESRTTDRTRYHNHSTPDRRTRAQQRRSRNRAQTASSNWARVWQSVWDHLNIDLDFPYHDGSSSSQLRGAQRRTTSQRRDTQEWERRFQVAEMQGGTNRFRDAASALLLDRPTFSRPRIQPPEPESVEEILAWNALEKARDIEADPCPKTRKRKSATNSPSDADPNKRRRNRKSVTVSPSDPTPVPQLDRPLKRPQTRRIHNLADASSDAVPESSSSRKSTTTTFHGDHASDSIGTGNGPSFLQSLLKEVESSAAPEEGKGKTRHLPNLSYIIPSDHSSPRYSSPGASPTSSNHPTPRALSATPPPSLSARPGSPIPLSSKVEPIYPLPEFSPERSPPSDSPLPHRRRPRSRTQQTNGQYRPRSEEASPTRLNMPLTTKSEIQKMVKDALKSPYQKNEVSKDQYTEINRNVSRMLYDRVGESANLEGESANSWRKIAEEEVSKAVQAINAIAIT